MERIKNPNRIYTITRKDIETNEQKTIQSMHAGGKYITEHEPHRKGLWDGNDSMIALELGSEKSLKKWIKKLEEKGIAFSLFKEPDMDYAITAIAALDTGELFKGIPLLNHR